MDTKGKGWGRGSANVKSHTCADGLERRIEPVYFREVNEQTGTRHFVRRAWCCGHCGYGDWAIV